MGNHLLQCTFSGKEKAKLYDCIDKHGKLYLELGLDDVCLVNSDTGAKVVSFGSFTPELMQNFLRFCGIYTTISNTD